MTRPYSRTHGHPFPSLLLLCAFLAGAATAQQGDREGHLKMDSIVPEELIPPAPVLSVAEALEAFEIAPGYVIEPVAAEPMVERPVALKFDPDGRLWVCEMRGYMPEIDGQGEDIPQGRIVVLEDTDDDGAVDTRTVFLDKVLLPRALHPTRDGLLFADHHSLQFIARDGLKPVGEPEVVDPDYAGTGNVEHKDNGLVRGLDNWLYNAKSSRRYRRIGGKWVMEKTHFRGQWGISKDNFGRLFYNSNSVLLQGDPILPRVLDGNPGARIKRKSNTQLGPNRVWPVRVTPGINRGYISTLNGYDMNMLDPETYKLIDATAACSPEIYRGDNFPETGHALAFVAECSVNLVKAIAVTEEKGRLRARHVYKQSEFLASTDERFRPVFLTTAPDGCLYLLDMYHGIIQHRAYVTSYLREHILKQGLDEPAHGTGRIYRIRHARNPRGKPPRLENASTKVLVSTLRHPNGWWRDTAQQALIERRAMESVPDLRQILKDSSHPVAQLHAFWTLEGLGALEAREIRWALGQAQAPKMVATAFAACLDLPRDTLEALEPALLAAPADNELAVYRNRILARLGTPAALQAVVDTLCDRPWQPFLPEATMAGLEGREEAFIAANNGRYQSSTFEKWLENSRRPSRSRSKGPKLSPEHQAAYDKGRDLYRTVAACIGCHGSEGEGMDNLGPPLDESEWVTGPEERLVKILLHGMHGPLTVNGERYNPPAAMPGLSLNPLMDDAAIAAIATYIRHSWENTAPMVTEETVKEVRAATAARAGQPYTATDFN